MPRPPYNMPILAVMIFKENITAIHFLLNCARSVEPTSYLKLEIPGNRERINNYKADQANQNIQYGAKVGPMELYMACCTGNIPIIELLLSHAPHLALEEPLFGAVSYGKKTAVALLLEKKKGLLNTLNKNGQSPLYAAASNGHTNVIQLLLELGADKNIHCKEETPLYAAVNQGHYEAVRLLWDNQTQADENCICNREFLVYVANKNRHETIERFLLRKQKNYRELQLQSGNGFKRCCQPRT